MTLTVSAARVSSTSSTAVAQPVDVAALGVLAQLVEPVGRVDDVLGAVATHATSRSHSPVSRSASSSVRVRARRPARLAASAPSRSARLRSCSGSTSASALRLRLDRRACASSPSALARCEQRASTGSSSRSPVQARRARRPRPRRAARGPRRAPARARGRRRRARAARTRCAVSGVARGRRQLRLERRRAAARRSAPAGSALAIVGSTSPGRSVSSTRCANDGGSSSVFSIRLAASSFIVSTPSRTNTRRCASNGVRDAAPTTGSSMSATRMIARRRSARPTSGPGARRACTRARVRVGVGRALGEQLGGERARGARLAGARRPVEEVGVRGVARPAARRCSSTALAWGWRSSGGGQRHRRARVRVGSAR